MTAAPPRPQQHQTQGQDEQAPLSLLHEQAALGCPLVDENTMDEMSGLEPGDFSLQLHATLWASMQRVRASGTPLHVLSVLADLQATLPAGAEVLDVARSYLPGLYNLTPVAAGAEYHAERVRAFALNRRLRETAENMLLFGDEDLRATQAAEAMATLLVNAGTKAARPREQAAIVSATLDRIEERATTTQGEGLPVGIPALQALGGFRPGHFVVLAARPSVGKSLLAYQMAHHAAAHDVPGLFVSLEMDAEELDERLLAAESHVSARALSQASLLSDDNWSALQAAAAVISTRRLPVIDAGGVTLDTIASWARRLKSTAGLAFLVIDYIQLLPMPNVERVSEAAALSAITKRLKALARQLRICVIGLSQLNRDGDGERPLLRHLRGSDTLSHDADLVMMLWPNTERGTDGYTVDGMRHLVLDVRKNRHGAEPAVDLIFNPARLTIGEEVRSR